MLVFMFMAYGLLLTISYVQVPILSTRFMQFLTNVFSYNNVRQYICWQVGRGNQVFIGVDTIVALLHCFRLSRDLISHLHQRNTVVLKHASVASEDVEPGWISLEALSLQGDLYLEWDNYVSLLYLVGVISTKCSDRLVWSFNKKAGDVSTKLAYQSLVK